MDTTILKEIGLTKNEITIYLSSLELGSSTAIEVAKYTKLHRPNVYDTLNRLVKKGLIAHYKRKDTTFYEAVGPEQLLTLIRGKELELLKLIPELKLKQLSAKKKSDLTILEGISGVRRAMTEMIESTKSFSVMGVPKDFAKTIGEGWAKQWHEDRIKKKITFNHIVNQDYYKHRIKLLNSLEYTSIKFLPKEYGTPMTLFIYDQGIMLGFTRPLVIIKIIGEDVAKSFKNYYKMLEKIATESP